MKIRKYGAASVPVDAAHCHPPLFAAGSASAAVAAVAAGLLLTRARLQPPAPRTRDALWLAALGVAADLQQVLQPEALGVLERGAP